MPWTLANSSIPGNSNGLTRTVTILTLQSHVPEPLSVSGKPGHPVIGPRESDDIREKHIKYKTWKGRSKISI
jgi:hypothetical protein